MISLFTYTTQDHLIYSAHPSHFAPTAAESQNPPHHPTRHYPIHPPHLAAPAPENAEVLLHAAALRHPVAFVYVLLLVLHRLSSLWRCARERARLALHPVRVVRGMDCAVYVLVAAGLAVLRWQRRQQLRC